MKNVYPAIIYKKELNDDYHLIYISDFDKTTQGKDIVECIESARDLIGVMGMDYLKDNKDIPKPFTNKNKYAFDDNLKIEFETLIDIDFTEYKNRLENKAVKKTLTIPYYLNEKAEENGINFSKVLRESLEEKLLNK